MAADGQLDETDPIDRTRFPIEEWRLTEVYPSSDDLGTTETLFAVGNGYLGMRGNVEEGRETHAHGTFINGFHETWDIRHAEEAFGFARTGQTIVNLPDTKVIKLYVDDEPLLLSVADLESYERSLDFRAGALTRDLVWRSPSGKRVRVRSTRMVSFIERHLAVMTFEVTMLDADAPVAVSSQVLNRQDGEDEYHVKAAAMGGGQDPRKASRFTERVLVPQSHWSSDRRIVLSYRTARSKMTLAVGIDHEIRTDNAYEELSHAEEDLAKKVYRIDARKGVPILITKVVAYHSSRGVPVRELVDRSRRTLDRIRDRGVQRCFDEQRTWLERYWRDSDVVVDDQPAIQQAIRWNLFQVAQASARVEQGGIPAKGVSGSGYEGHFFWDTEIYVLPFLIYTSPWIARGSLRFRYQMLPAARRRARELAQAGALFPWRTINGEEASAFYAAGTAQYHIDADIAYALSKYVAATGDDDFMLREGIDILVETARLWADLGFWLGQSNPSYHIHGVTGPDEYTTVVNNNLFTNVMARANLRHAAYWCRRLAERSPEGYQRLVKRLDLDDDEVEEWQHCAEGIYIPYDKGLKVHPQDQHFLEREVWDLEATPPDQRPLLLHYHPLVIYRFQVLKQADVVAALFLQGDTFTHEEKKADFEYYDPITTGDSTLSAVVQSIIAAEVGYHDLALRYFHTGLFVDLADLHRNAADGVHVASTGGVWNALVYGFGGMRDHNGAITFDPRLPATWSRLSYSLRLRDSRVRVELTRDALTFTLLKGPEVHVSVRRQPVVIAVDAPTVVTLTDQGQAIDGGLGTLPLVGSEDEHGLVYTLGVPTRIGAGDDAGTGSVTQTMSARPLLPQVRWGVIGVGDVVERKSGPALQRVEGSALVAVMRRDAARAEDFARRHGVPRWYADADELIADPEVDAVYVATPPDSHRDYVERVAAAGKPVYVEKPMARTAAECESMITACATAGVPLFVAYYRRAMPRFVRARTLIESGAIGTVRSVVVRNQRPAADPSAAIPWRLQPQVSGGGYFVDLASHTLDLLDEWFGPIVHVVGEAGHPDGGDADTPESVVTAAFRHAGGVQGIGLWDYDAAEARDELEVVGSAGTLQLSSFGQEPIQLRRGRGVELVDAPYPEIVQQPLIQTIVEALRTGTPTPSTGISALRTAQVIDTLLATYRTRHGITFT